MSLEADVASPRREGKIPGEKREGLRGLAELVWLLAVTDFRRRYAQTLLGYLWIVIGPLLYFGTVYLFVSEIVQRYTGRIPDFGTLLLFNLVLFVFFRQAAGTSIRSLSAKGGVVRKMPIPRIVLPASTIMSSGIVLAANLVLVFAWILAAGVQPTWTWLLMPVILAWLVVITVGVSLLLAGTYVGVRDIREVWPIVARILFYGTPILYPIEVVPKKILFDALSFNPLAPLFVQARVWIIDSNAPTWFASKGAGVMGLLPFALSIVICVAGVAVFRRASRGVAETL